MPLLYLQIFFILSRESPQTHKYVPASSPQYVVSLFYLYYKGLYSLKLVWISIDSFSVLYPPQILPILFIIKLLSFPRSMSTCWNSYPAHIFLSMSTCNKFNLLNSIPPPPHHRGTCSGYEHCVFLQ